MNTNQYLGIDCGSVTLKIIIMDESGHQLYRSCKRTNGDPIKALLSMFKSVIKDDAIEENKNINGIYITGSGRHLIKSIIGGYDVNEITAHGTASAYFHPESRTVIEIGGQDSKLIILKKVNSHKAPLIIDSQMNDICAAGTGSFLDQQAFRLGIGINALSEKAMFSKNPAKISGKCSVFAKTDLIHMQQSGMAVEDMSAGLCKSVARTYIENMVRGRKICKPILLQGGVAKNEGVKKSFMELLALSDGELIIPKYYQEMGAIGAILHGIKKKKFSDQISINQLIERIGKYRVVKNKGVNLKPLTKDNIISSLKAYEFDPSAGYDKAYMGIDVGSVSVKVVIVDIDKNMLYKHYTVTKGNPIESVRKCFMHIQKKFPNGIDIDGVGVTGSGRDYIANFINADFVMNEITAQAKGTALLMPDTDVIIEIGGQDSKYIRLHDSVVTEFMMNKTCAAGTGSFLSEQCDRLSMPLADFSAIAFMAENPVDMGTRCTVFMETDCIHYQQQGHKKEDILAGLSYSIAKNYIEKVVGNKSLEGKVVIQGGIAFNKSVVSAFSHILNKKIMIAPHHEVTGAMGMAIYTAENMNRSKTRFVGLDLENRIVKTKIKECKDCSNMCSLVHVFYNNSERAIHGSMCGKYEKNKSVKQYKGENYFKKREKLLLSFEKLSGDVEKTIGIPSILLFHELYPMWAAFFDSLNCKVVLSEKMSESIYKKGISKVLVDTCYPLRCIYGAVIDLIEKGVDRIFIPYVLNMSTISECTQYSHNCQYVQQVADFINSSMDVNILTHTVRMHEGESSTRKAFVDLGRMLGVSRSESLHAFKQAYAAQNAFYDGCEQLGREALAAMKSQRKILVLIGHSYILHDTYFNLNLVKRLAKSGIPAIPSDILPIHLKTVDNAAIDLAWKTNNSAVKALNYIHRHNLVHKTKLLPVIITQFGCAADSMLIPFVKDLFGNNPWLEIEVDEHNSIHGIMTRCEAFWESIPENIDARPAFYNIERLFDTQIDIKRIRKENRKVLIFHMCESFCAIPHVLKKHGIESEMIGKTSTYSNDLGRKYASENHCRTFQVVLGDCIAAAQSHNFDPEQNAILMINYDDACRVALFKYLCPKLLKEHGVGELKMFCVTIDDPLDWIGTFGINIATDLWNGLVAADFLSRYRYQLRPYEVQIGAIEIAYGAAKEALFNSIYEGQLLKGFRQAMEILKKVPVKECNLVHIGVVGDAFTRVHEYGMMDIFRTIERMEGVLIIPPSWNDFISYGAEQRVYEFIRKKKYFNALKAKFGSSNINRLKREIQAIASTYSEMFDEPDNAMLTEYAKPYVNVNVAPVIPSMFVGKTVDFVKNKNVHGLINAYGFNCSLGKISTACINRMRQDYSDIPMLTVIDDGLQQTNIQTRVEAFMQQAWYYKRECEKMNKAGYSKEYYPEEIEW